MLLAVVGVALAAMSIGPLEPKPDKFSESNIPLQTFKYVAIKDRVK